MYAPARGPVLTACSTTTSRSRAASGRKYAATRNRRWLDPVALGLDFGAHLGHETRKLCRIGEGIHGREALEHVLAVEDGWLVHAAIGQDRRATPERAIDRGAADQHRQMDSASV